MGVANGLRPARGCSSLAREPPRPAAGFASPGVIMSVPTSAADLLDLVRKSGMVDEVKLAAYCRRRDAAGGQPADARALADDMIRAGLITHFQSEQYLLGKWRGFTIGKYKLL